MGFDVTLWGALVAGFLSFASPCVLPLVPPYLGFLAGATLGELTGEDEAPGARRRVLLAAIVFALGFATVFTIMGASASALGQALGRNIDWLGMVAGGVLILFGLHFLGLITIPLLYRQARFEVDRRPTSLLGAYVVGLAFAFGWTPCVGPVLAAILFTAGAQGDPAQGALLLFAYALGIGVPFVIAAGFAGPFLRLMKRYRGYVRRVEQILGVLLIVTGLLFITGQMRMLGFWLLEYAPWLGGVG